MIYDRSKPRQRLRFATVVCILASAFAFESAAVDVGAPAPDVSLPALTGKFESSQARGKVLYVDFWASWCVPCRQSFPWMNEMQAKYAARGLQIVAINVDAKRADAERFLGQVESKVTIAFDANGDTPKRFGVKGMPSSYLIAGDGRLIKAHSGFRDSDKAALEAAIVAALDATQRK
ncbi:MAG: TlpA family protein disulfide reductase [Burkholderiales bacterium]|nr:TlpA family protein disulfide reductase [Burkholderiales bacterium]